jgi:hypothetical protein
MPRRKQYKISAKQTAIYDVIVAELQQNPELADYDMTEGGKQAFQLSEEKRKRTALPNLALKWMKITVVSSQYFRFILASFGKNKWVKVYMNGLNSLMDSIIMF